MTVAWGNMNQCSCSMSWGKEGTDGDQSGMGMVQEVRRRSVVGGRVARELEGLV